MRRKLILTLTALLAVVALVATAAAAQSQSATVTEATGGKGGPTMAGTNFDLASVGYEGSEYFLGGTAQSYTSAQPLTVDGKWTVTPASSAPYKTRLVVYRPSDPKKFNGTVMVEWLNVSAGLDSAPIWLAAHTELIRKGYAWVGVSAQIVGVEGGGRAVVPNLDLKHADPERYGSLVHPGDSSYDMYTQTGDAVRNDAATLLGGLKPKHVMAAGRVAELRPHGHLRRRAWQGRRQPLRRLPRVQPGWQRRRAVAGPTG
ncbi:MAG: alpha/beta hydrolase domain-containing protein [Acidimicrobiia bacterium]